MMTAGFSPRDAAGLRERLNGRVVLPGEEKYDAARQVWNASHDYRPALIAQPLSVPDVQAAVRLPARSSGRGSWPTAQHRASRLICQPRRASPRDEPSRNCRIDHGGR